MREGSGSSARTPMMMASPPASTRTTVRADGAAPCAGSTCVRLVTESAPAHAGSSNRPSTRIAPRDDPTRSVVPAGRWVDAMPAALDNTAAATTAARGNVGLAVTGSASCVECRPQTPKDVGEGTVRPEVDVVDPRLLAHEMAVHRRRHDTACREGREHRADLLTEESEVSRGDRPPGWHRLDVDGAPVPERGRHGPAVHRHRSRDQDGGHLGDRALCPAGETERAEHQCRIDRDG